MTMVACSGAVSTTAPAAAGAAAAAGAEAGAAPSAAPAGATTNGGGGTSVDACNLVTPDVLQTALGGSFGAGQATAAPGSGSVCNFPREGLTVAVLPGGRLIFDSLRTSYTGVVDVPGVADGAYYSSDSAVMVFLKGDAVGELLASNAAYNDQAKLAALATAIAPKL